MGRFPQCKKFIAEEAPKYAALEVIQVRGSAPIVHWLDKYGQTVSTTNIKETDSVEDHHRIFAEHGVTLDTPKPTWVEKGHQETPHCIAFRRHTTTKERLPREDTTCSESIPPGGGIGFCECKPNSPVAKIEIAVHHKRSRFTCEEVCGTGKLPWADDEEL
eukprot:TRINITY_DN4569_c0_g1_i2.p1 TRINITY_DN4569_c0_g1~~TRINITY_DN4569_c0_g1_i2.p1  ORF type:complete len:161 (+),score=28.91 TRINITY_DN4569_c0_g1_i2:153-635(+)